MLSVTIHDLKQNNEMFSGLLEEAVDENCAKLQGIILYKVFSWVFSQSMNI